MYQDSIVLCGSNAYEQKYYLNDNFEAKNKEFREIGEFSDIVR